MKPSQRTLTFRSSISIVRFDVRADGEGWTVYDRLTEEPAVVEGEKTVGLPKGDAEDIADMLNTLALMQGQQTVH